MIEKRRRKRHGSHIFLITLILTIALGSVVLGCSMIWAVGSPQLVAVKLESQLATRLLERNTRRQSLTDAGRVYFDEAKRVMEQVSIAESAVERLRLAPAGTLRVSAPTSFGASVIAPLTATFLQAWPAVRVELDLTNRMVDLVDEGFDLAIRIGEIHQEDLVARYLAPYRMVICAAPAYLARYGTPGRPEDLADHLCLSHTVWTARNEWRLPGVEGEVRWKRDAVLRCNDGYALRQAAIAGAGLLMQPEVLLADALASGSLVRVLEAWTPQPRPVHLLWRQDRRPLPKLTQFIAHLQQGMADALTTTRASE